MKALGRKPSIPEFLKRPEDVLKENQNLLDPGEQIINLLKALKIHHDHTSLLLAKEKV